MILIELHGSEAVAFRIGQVIHRLGIWRDDRHSDVDTLAMSQILNANGGRDNRAPVAALGKILGIAKPQHKLIPGLRDFFNAPSGLGRLTRKAEAGERWTDQVKCLFGGAAMGNWIR